MDACDVMVIGLGVHGSAAAAALARRGLRVVGCECSPSDEVWGASAGPWRMLRVTDPQRPQLRALGREARHCWDALAERRASPLIRATAAVAVGARSVVSERVGRSSVIAPDDARLAGLAPAVRAHGAVVDPDCALLDARAAVSALRADAVAAGAELYFDQLVNLAEPAPAAGRLRLGDREVRADRILVCLGAEVIELPVWQRPAGVRTEPAIMQHAPVGSSAGLDTDCFYLLDRGTDRFCVIPLSGSVQFGHFTTPAASGTGRAQLSRAAGRRDLTALRDIVPGWRGLREYSTAASAYTFTADGGFEIYRATPTMATLVACSGVGFKYAPALAERVAAVLVDGRGSDDQLRVSGIGPR